jgi:hypothetical protein
MVTIADISYGKTKVEHNENVPRVTALMQDAAKILTESEPDGSDTFFAPEPDGSDTFFAPPEMQEVI